MTPTAPKKTAIVLIDCPGRKGIVAVVSDFLLRHNANILHADQHQGADLGLLQMRIGWDLIGFDLDAKRFAGKFAAIARRFEMHWRLEFSEVRPRMAIFVSRYDHCLADLLYRRESGELHCEIPLVISNHSDAQRLAEFYRVPFYHIPTGSVSKQKGGEKQMALLREHSLHLVVIAR